MKKTTRQKKGSVIAILAVLFTGGLSATDSDVEAGIALLKAKGIPAFVQTIARDKTRAMPSVRSDKMAGKTGDQNPNDRLLGQELIDALQTRENLAFQDLMTRTDETLEIRDWALRKAGYGNLLVAYTAEAAATRLLFRSLAATNCDLGAVEAQVKRLRTDSPSTAYWLDVLNTEEVPEPALARGLEEERRGKKKPAVSKADG
jgi:hypothetical protein